MYIIKCLKMIVIIVFCISSILGCSNVQEKDDSSFSPGYPAGQNPQQGFEDYTEAIISNIQSELNASLTSINITINKQVNQGNFVHLLFSTDEGDYEGVVFTSKDSNAKWIIENKAYAKLDKDSPITELRMTLNSEKNTSYDLISGTINDDLISRIRITYSDGSTEETDKLVSGTYLFICLDDNVETVDKIQAYSENGVLIYEG